MEPPRIPSVEWFPERIKSSKEATYHQSEREKKAHSEVAVRLGGMQIPVGKARYDTGVYSLWRGLCRDMSGKVYARTFGP